MRRLLLCALGALFFVGCGDGGGPAANPSTPTTTTTPQAPTATSTVAPNASPTASPSVATTPARVAWAAGGNSLLRSDDGGFHWRDTGRGASGLAFATRDIGWTFFEGGRGQLWRTVDGGGTWEDQLPNLVGTAPIVFDLATMDGVHAVAVGAAPPVDVLQYGPPAALYTEDAGAIWRAATMPAFDPARVMDVELLSVCITATGLGLATGTDVKNFTATVVLTTHDSGRSWDEITARLPHDPLAQAACGADGRLWFLGAESTLMVSADGGASWEGRGTALPAHRTLEGGVFLTDGIAWLAALDAPPGHRLLAYRSDDDGSTWTEHVITSEPVEIEKLGLAAVDGAHAVVVAQDEHPFEFPRSSFGRSWVTIDGGATWAATEHPEPIDALWDVALLP